MPPSERAMEVKASGAFFSAQGTADHHPGCDGKVVPHRCAHGRPRTLFPGGAGRREACAAGSSSKLLVEYKPSSSIPVPETTRVPKAALGTIRTVTPPWRQPEMRGRTVRSSSIGARYPSLERFTCKRYSVDRLAVLALHEPIGGVLLQDEPPPEHLGSVKPKNCRRIVVLGARRVGKTSILRRFLRDGFEERYEPTAEDFHRKLYQIRGETYQLDILDASGERDFPAKRRLSILTGDIFLLVFSMDDRDSLDELAALLKEVVAAKAKLLKTRENSCVPVVICGNKVDLSPEERTVSRADVCQALGNDFPYFETSAKNGTNLEEMFEALAERGGLPTETGPSQHRKVSIRSYRALHSGRRVGRRLTVVHDTPCGVVCPLTRRPSFNTDLRRVLGPNSSRKRRKPLDKCQIQ
ncbi:GTP-binding protein Rhes-like [Scleropages formosus]|uniref:RASD family member 2a n=1 Tax=Scleropages formosus TaxID=113540 RepID=A0A8C9TMC1_SCLFO|nr:GTP-binding protein Rhes-like [Scleropages formosus]